MNLSYKGTATDFESIITKHWGKVRLLCLCKDCFLLSIRIIAVTNAVKKSPMGKKTVPENLNIPYEQLRTIFTIIYFFGLFYAWWRFLYMFVYYQNSEVTADARRGHLSLCNWLRRRLLGNMVVLRTELRPPGREISVLKDHRGWVIPPATVFLSCKSRVGILVMGKRQSYFFILLS